MLTVGTYHWELLVSLLSSYFVFVTLEDCSLLCCRKEVSHHGSKVFAICGTFNQNIQIIIQPARIALLEAESTAVFIILAMTFE